MSGMLVSLLCVFSLIAIRGLNLISCDACGEDSFILESGNNHTKEAQPATCGNREDLLYENIANITFIQSSTLPDVPERNWIEVSSHQVDYISIARLDSFDELGDNDNLNEKNVVVSCAIFLNKIRLIDNILI